MKQPSLSTIQHIMISRTDSIGDVILTLPLAKIIKDAFPEMRISFLGKSYTRAVIESCAYIDCFVDLEDFIHHPFPGKIPDAIIHVFPVRKVAVRAKALGIHWRIGTTGRLYHWYTCNKLVRLSRKKSELHEAQLNTVLLQPLGIRRSFSLQEIGTSFGMTRISRLPAELQALIDPDRFNLILHPRSQGSAREWGLDRFAELIRLLPRNSFKIFISGTARERETINTLFEEAGDLVTDICGKMDLATFISFIRACNGLVANSTGPLHIAAAVGIRAVGIYPPVRPMHPGRWQPLGPQASYLVAAAPCSLCEKDPAMCQCMKAITPKAVEAQLLH